MAIRILKTPITKVELSEIASEAFGDVVKAVVDVEKEIMAVGGELHADEEIFLMEHEDSKREHMWGINIYLKKPAREMVEFDSMINLKPSFGNKSRDVESEHIKEKIRQIVDKLIID